MWGVLDFIGEISGSFPYLYRAWFWLFSASYRKSLRAEYRNRSILYVSSDVVISAVFFGIECWLIYMGVNYIVG